MDKFRFAAGAEAAGDMVEFLGIAQAREDGLDVRREQHFIIARREQRQRSLRRSRHAAGDGGRKGAEWLADGSRP